MAYSSVTGAVGDANRRLTLSQASRNYTTRYFRTAHASGDIRINYDHMRFAAAGSGEVIRATAEAYGTGSAAGGTINGAHITGRVGSAGTVSGALNAIRATLEIARTSGSAGGTLAALQLDSNVSHDNAMGANDAFVRVTNSGAHTVDNLFNIEVAPATDTPTALVSTHADHVSTHLIKCRVNGADMWLLATNAHT
jgi:hypothetical protein